MSDLRDTERPYQIFGVLDGSEGFHSGHIDKSQAEHALAEANKNATELGIKTRYILKEVTAVVPPPVTEEIKKSE